MTGIGRAPGDRANAREQALTDALRDAVRKGAGIDLISSTNVSDFALEYDRVFAAAFGHVKDYKVVDQYLDEAELYVVNCLATVTDAHYCHQASTNSAPMLEATSHSVGAPRSKKAAGSGEI